MTPETDSQEALEIFKRDPDAFDLLITDMTMPKMTGLELAAEMKRVKSDLRVIICSGFNMVKDDKTFGDVSIDTYLVKPVMQKNFVDAIENIQGREMSCIKPKS